MCNRHRMPRIATTAEMTTRGSRRSGVNHWTNGLEAPAARDWRRAAGAGVPLARDRGDGAGEPGAWSCGNASSTRSI
jgi:hypothetical protein